MGELPIEQPSYAQGASAAGAAQAGSKVRNCLKSGCMSMKMGTWAGRQIRHLESGLDTRIGSCILKEAQ
jgi:hypothetical protein